MIRVLHRWLGLLLAGLLLVISLSGAVLAIFPALDAFRTVPVDPGLSVAELAQRVSLSHPGLEEIQRGASGQITAWWFDADLPGSAVIDPTTGQDLMSADPDPQRRWITRLHRSMFLDDAGRLMAAVGAIAMLFLAISGACLVARRVGGWHRWLSRLHGPMSGRLHTELARIAVVGLTLSSMTAIWMAGETFDMIQLENAAIAAPTEVSTRPALSLTEIAALRAVPVQSLRKLSFPDPTDPLDVFTLTTVDGTGYVDPGTGLLLVWQEHGFAQLFSESIYMLHTGQGVAWLGVVLGLMALTVPLLALTGIQVWVAKRRTMPATELRRAKKDNTRPEQAQTIILVGSESGSTWGFAGELARPLLAAGQTVHVAAMNDFSPSRYLCARRFIILVATYGQGDAPSSADRFLERMRKLDSLPKAPLAILGFGDSSFKDFCAYARLVQQSADAMGWPSLIPFDTIDRQSSQAFARWGRRLGNALGVELDLSYQPAIPATRTLTLIDRRDYGFVVKVPMAILRFALPSMSLWQRLTGQGFARFEPGDLIGILPTGSGTPRLYSLASGARDGFVEIVVRKHPHGLMSGQLTSLEPGQQVSAYLSPHQTFHAGSGSEPLILIGAGTGVGPLVGFIRANKRRRSIHLFFGLRDPASDFLYESELGGWQEDGRLAGLHLAVSRASPPQYVQDILHTHSEWVSRCIGQGAKVMVCGSQQMAEGVREVMVDLLSPLGLSVSALKERGCYVEDVY